MYKHQTTSDGQWAAKLGHLVGVGSDESGVLDVIICVDQAAFVGPLSSLAVTSVILSCPRGSQSQTLSAGRYSGGVRGGGGAVPGLSVTGQAWEAWGGLGAETMAAKPPTISSH